MVKIQGVEIQSRGVSLGTTSYRTFASVPSSFLLALLLQLCAKQTVTLSELKGKWRDVGFTQSKLDELIAYVYTYIHNSNVYLYTYLLRYVHVRESFLYRVWSVAL